MTYIESHKELVGHPKTKKAARLLGVSIPTALGHLHMLWYWAMDYADDGNLTDHDPQDIADAVAWDGEPQAFIDALVNCGLNRGSGFLDLVDGQLTIHDWMQYAGNLIERRRLDAQRKRAARLNKNDPDPTPSSGHPMDGARTAHVPYPTQSYPVNPTEPIIAEPQNITPIATETASAAPSRKEIVKAVVTKPIEQLPKPRNPYWDALVEIMGHDAEPSKTGAWGKAIHDIKIMQGTPDDIRIRAAIYPKRFPTRTEPLTPTALAGSWHKCDPDKFAAAAPPAQPRKFNRVGSPRASPDNRSASSTPADSRIA